MFRLLCHKTVVVLRNGGFGAGTVFSGGGDLCKFFTSAFLRVEDQGSAQKLSAYDVNLVLRENEYTHHFAEEGSVLSYETNQLASNKPCEDRYTQANFLHKNGFICGIYDGHAGSLCAEVVAKRLLRYIAASVIPREKLLQQVDNGYNSESFLKCHNDKVDFVSDIKEIYEASFKNYIDSITSQKQMYIADAMANAFKCLDEDISKEALDYENPLTIAVAMQGAVAIVAHVDEEHLYVASTGDCGAVLGAQCPETGVWLAKALSTEHSTNNAQEVQRILSEHPKQEHDTILRGERLLGQLAPLRAFGDYRYKWSKETLEERIENKYGKHIPPHYYTPPYLTAVPEVEHHVLGPNDKFVVLASDGLWDFMTPSQVVAFVGAHISTQKVLEPIKLPDGEITLGEVAQLIKEKKSGRTSKALDENSATLLIRNALGSTETGIEHAKISYYLSIPQNEVRYYRDDITINVIYFNSEYIKKKMKNPSSNRGI